MRAGTSNRVLRRFECCGGGCFIQVNRDTGEARASGYYCGNRNCQPCNRSRAGVVRAKLEELASKGEPRAIVISQRAVAGTMIEAQDRFRKSLKKFMRTTSWTDCVRGWVTVYEVKRAKLCGHWHFHAHILTVGIWHDAEKMRAAWRRAAGDGSNHVHIEKVRGMQCVGYVLKYLTKGYDNSVLDNPDDLVEVIKGLRGRRMMDPGGEWRGVPLEDETPLRGRWEIVGSLDSVWAQARRGSEWAVGVMLQLRRGEAMPPDDSG